MSSSAHNRRPALLLGATVGVFATVGVLLLTANPQAALWAKTTQQADVQVCDNNPEPESLDGVALAGGRPGSDPPPLSAAVEMKNGPGVGAEPHDGRMSLAQHAKVALSTTQRTSRAQGRLRTSNENSSVALAPPAALGNPKAYPNSFCIGRTGSSGVKESSDPDDPMPTDPGEVDGKGYICAKALGKSKCKTAEELASLYCACCECYVQCGLGITVWAVCKHDGTCSE
ncbi:hypothetical protein T492DRAFT_843875 [Pavlovales sp. CCMP2436]|nr:hypothetical protein T492DRAFT_843875 [Pavlovales sp. CCMP2436]